METQISPVRLVGVSGKAGAGKDEFAEMLNLITQDRLGKEYEIKKYAGKLKETVKLLTGATDWHMNTQEGKKTYLKEWGMDIRKFQQLIGTEAIRNNLHPNAWVIALYSDYTENSLWVVTDVRFPNEVEAIEERGGIIVRIESDRPGVGAGDHPSETALDDHKFDHVIYNNGTLEEYREKCVDFIMEYVLNLEQTHV